MLLLCGVAAATLLEGERDLTDYTFKQYIIEFEKEYTVLERAKRAVIFHRNLADILEQNADPNKNWFAAVNQFTDMTKEEFKSYYQGKKPSMPLFGGSKASPANPNVVLPDEVDWRNVAGVVTPVKNQKSCGSCWAFSATESLESHFAINTGLSAPILSPQQIVSCTPNPNQCGGSGGCDGATEPLAFNYTMGAGITTEASYPYTARTGTCNASKIKPVARNSGFVELTPNSYTDLVTALATAGPVSIGVAADIWQFYGGGVFDNKRCGYTMDHGVVAVGYGTDAKSGQMYWLVRNSWGQFWGEKGYIRLVRFGEGKEPCGMDNNPADGDACAGDNTPREYCGQCAILSSSSYPTGVSKV